MPSASLRNGPKNYIQYLLSTLFSRTYKKIFLQVSVLGIVKFVLNNAVICLTNSMTRGTDLVSLSVLAAGSKSGSTYNQQTALQINLDSNFTPGSISLSLTLVYPLTQFSHSPIFNFFNLLYYKFLLMDFNPFFKNKRNEHTIKLLQRISIPYFTLSIIFCVLCHNTYFLLK